MLTSKVICDNIYLNKSWSIISQEMFALREINQIECKMCSYLEWQLNIDPSQLRDFKSKIWQDFKGPGLYLNYILPSLAPTSMPSTTLYAASIHNPFLRHCQLLYPGLFCYESISSIYTLFHWFYIILLAWIGSIIAHLLITLASSLSLSFIAFSSMYCH